MNRFVRLNTLPGFSSVRSYYWLDVTKKSLVSYSRTDCDPDLSKSDIQLPKSYYLTGYTTGDNTQYKLSTVYKRLLSTQMRSILRAYSQMLNNIKCEPNSDVHVKSPDLTEICENKLSEVYYVPEVYYVIADGKVLKSESRLTSEKEAKEFANTYLNQSESAITIVKHVATARSVRNVMWS